MFMSSHHNHHKCKQALLSRAEDICRASGSRLTDQRRDILSCVAEDHSAVGAYDIIDRMAQKGVTHAPVTIYRALEFLEAHGLVHKIESRNAFVACSTLHDGRPAALLVCDSCNTVEEMDMPDVFRSIGEKAEQTGFQPRQTVVEVEGLCEACRSKNSPLVPERGLKAKRPLMNYSAINTRRTCQPVKIGSVMVGGHGACRCPIDDEYRYSRC